MSASSFNILADMSGVSGTELVSCKNEVLPWRPEYYVVHILYVKYNVEIMVLSFAMTTL